MQAFPPPGTKGKVGSVDEIDIEAEKRILDIQQDPNLKKIDDVAKKNINKGQDKLLDKVNKAKVTSSGGRVVQQALPGMEGGEGKKKRSDAGKSRGRYRRKYIAAPGQLQLDFTKKADRKQVKQDIAAVAKEPMKKAVMPTLRTTAKATKGTLAKIVKNPVGTAIAAGIARDSFRMPQLPPMPKVSGGKVGRRTAG